MPDPDWLAGQRHEPRLLSTSGEGCCVYGGPYLGLPRVFRGSPSRHSRAGTVPSPCTKRKGLLKLVLPTS